MKIGLRQDGIDTYLMVETADGHQYEASLFGLLIGSLLTTLGLLVLMMVPLLVVAVYGAIREALFLPSCY
jgi:hypothetical protein